MKARSALLVAALFTSLCSQAQAQVKVSLVDLSREDIGSTVALDISNRMRRLPMTAWVDDPKSGGIEARVSSVQVPKLEPADPQFVVITIIVLLHSGADKLWPSYMASQQRLCAEAVAQQCADTLFAAVKTQVNNLQVLIDASQRKR
jgi:hypothetical protein